MSNAKYTDLLDEVMPHVPGADTDIVVNAIKRAVIQFCVKSLVWRVPSDPITVYADGTADIDSPESNTQVVKVLSAKLAGRKDPILPKSPEWLDAWNPDWRTAIGEAQYFTQDNPLQMLVTLAPGSQLVGALTAQLALAPSIVSSGVEKWILDRYAEPLASGAIGRLMIMAKKPWTNAQLGLGHMQEFQAGIGAAMAQAAKGFGRGPLRTECVA